LANILTDVGKIVQKIRSGCRIVTEPETYDSPLHSPYYSQVCIEVCRDVTPVTV